MDFALATFSALFLLFAAASCAPAGLSLHGACVDVKSSSLELNRIAGRVSVEARNGSRDVTDYPTGLDWMEAQDMCDPKTLTQKPAPCLGKILKVLTSYISAVERVSGFKSCKGAVSAVKPVMLKLHKDMSKCIHSRTGVTNLTDSVGKNETEPIPRWKEEFLCHYTLDRLFSFSIIPARVFAVGDPANHTVVSAQSACRA